MHTFSIEQLFLNDESEYSISQFLYGNANFQVLAAVIKAGASREHEILAEIRDAVFSFIRKMEPKRVMDTMLVSRVRILYIRSLLARSPELQSIKVPEPEISPFPKVLLLRIYAIICCLAEFRLCIPTFSDFSC